MKKSKIPKLILVGLLAVLATTALATQVKLVTFGGGTGWTSSSGHRVAMTMGLPLAGRTSNSATQTMAVLGFWDVLNTTHIVSPVGDETPAVVNQLFRNYPNPFNPSTRISFTMAEEAQVKIEVYDLKGRRVDTVFEGVKAIGAHSITYQPKNLASGAYVILMRAGSFRATQLMMLVK